MQKTEETNDKPISSYYLLSITDLHLAVWECIKHVYPNSLIDDIQVKYNLQKVDTEKMTDYTPIEIKAKDADKIPIFNKAPVNGVFVFDSNDFYNMLLRFWKKQQGAHRNRKIEDEYRH